MAPKPPGKPTSGGGGGGGGGGGASTKAGGSKSKKSATKRTKDGQPVSSTSATAPSGNSEAPDAVDDIAEAAQGSRPDPTVGAHVVVIHPGSLSLRIGLVSAPSPVVIPHCVAWRRNGNINEDTPLRVTSGSEKEDLGSFDAAMQKALRSVGRALRIGTTLLSSEETAVAPSMELQTESTGTRTASTTQSDPYASERVLVGEAARRESRLHPDRWRLFYPMRRGRLSTEEPLSLVISAIETIWRAAIVGGCGVRGLGLDHAELRRACAVIVLPELFARREGTEILSAVFGAQLGFSAAMVHEEAPCACIGANVPSACVVDIGAHRSSVVCVDELMPMPGCRQVLAYGAEDLDRMLLWLLLRQNLASRFPSPLPRLTDASAAASHALATTLSPLRQACCSLRFDTPAAAAAAAPVNLPTPNGGSVNVKLSLGSLACVPPLLLFCPEAVRVMHDATTHADERAARRDLAIAEMRQIDPSDVWDDEFLQESTAPLRGAALGKGERETAEAEAEEASGRETPKSEGGRDVATPSAREIAREHKARLNAASSLADTPAASLPSLTPLGEKHQLGLMPDELLEYTPLDEDERSLLSARSRSDRARMTAAEIEDNTSRAIVRAVERGKSTEVKRRLYGSILLLGGLGQTDGLSEYLEWRIATCWRLAPDSTEGIERIEVQRLPESVSPEWLAWRGAAMLPSLDTEKTMWVLRKDWSARGVMAVRSACAFTW